VPGPRSRKPPTAPILLVFLLAAVSPPARGRVYTLACGPPQGVDFPLAREIASLARGAGMQIRVLPSEGARQNLLWISEGRADLTLVQSDVAWDAYQGHGGFPRPLTGLRAVAPLYVEAVHILVRRPLFLRRIEDLGGKRVSLGPAGSGTEANALQILAAAGRTPEEMTTRHLGIEEAVAALRAGDLDAAFLTVGVPSKPVALALSDRSASLLEPDLDLLERLREIYPFFLNKNIEPAEYHGLREEVTTVEVQALLVGRDGMPEGDVDRLVHALAESRGLAAKYRFPAPGDSGTDLAIPWFEPSRRYYTLKSFLHRRKLVGGILAGLLLLGLAAIGFRRGILHSLRRDDFLRGGLYFSVVWLAGSIALYWTEHRVNDYYSTLWKSLWSGLITIYSLSNKEPLTFEGRVVSVIMFLMGLAGLVWLTEKLASFYLETKIVPLFRDGFTRMHRMKDHYVIAGWNEKGPGILAQLQGEDLNDRRLIAILAEESRGKELSSHGLVHFERGERTREADLKRVHVHTAHSVILLADSADPAADARTILSILAIRKICSEQSPPRQVPVIAEIVDPGNVSLAAFAGAESSGTLEIVSSHEVGQGLLTQAAVHPGLSNVYRKLLTFSKDSSEIHSARVPEHFAGWSFDRLVQAGLDLNVLPIALQHGQEVRINPVSTRIEAGDILFALCDSPRDLEKLYRERGT
jgi:TRAP transporter TAXI family solute receptor